MSQPLPPDFSPWDAVPPEQPRPSRRRRGVITVILTLVVICAVAVILNESAFTVRAISVVGLKTISWEEAVTAAGLTGRVGYFSVDEEKIRQGVNANRYLVFERLERHFPDSLTLYVREREPCANVQVMGVMYLLDNEGVVLERLTGSPDEHFLTVTGFQAKEVRLGSRVVPSTVGALDAYQALMAELATQGFAGQVSELNLSDSDSLYLVTADGYTAHLGDATQLRGKIGTLRAVVAKLREMGKFGGVIEASVPGEATYTPVEL